MSVPTLIKKYDLIIQFLKRKKYADFEEIKHHLEQKEEILALRNEDYRFSISKRTFQRDIKNIWDNFNISIRYCRRNKGYCIDTDEELNIEVARIFELNEMASILSATNRLQDLILTEKNPPLGVHFMQVIINAIQKKHTLSISYASYRYDTPKEKKINPLFFKEYKQRWYIISYDHHAKKVKTYALDRIQEIRATGEQYAYNNLEQLRADYKDVYGITNTPAAPTKVIFKAKRLQASYLMSLPLHHSQTIIEESEQEDSVTFQLYVKVSNDLIIDLVSMGAQVKVIAPQSLINKIKVCHKEALSQYL